MAATELAATGRLECVVKPLIGTNRTSSNVRSSVALGVNRTWRGHRQTDANDPTRTLAPARVASRG